MKYNQTKKTVFDDRTTLRYYDETTLRHHEGKTPALITPNSQPSTFNPLPMAFGTQLFNYIHPNNLGMRNSLFNFLNEVVQMRSIKNV